MCQVLAYIEMGEAINAYREMEMAAQIDASNVDAIIKAAEMLFRGNDIDASSKRLKKALSVNPEHIDALILAANLELHAKHLNVAESYIDKAMALNPDFDRLYITKASIYLAKKDYERVFQSFVTFKEGGTGLGLSITQKILERLGGTIEAGLSNLGGARFSVTLPGKKRGIIQ